MNTTLKYTVIVIVDERQDDLNKFIKNLHTVFTERNESFEILVLANGTGTFIRNTIGDILNSFDNIRAFELNNKVPQAVCLNAGLKESKGDILLACGSYQQITTESLNKVLDALDSKTDIIAPWRTSRVDSKFRQIRSAVFNAITRVVIQSNLHDLNCTVKLFRREVLEEVQLYGNMYRYLPIVASRCGYTTKEVKCEHYQERGGKSGIHNLPEYFTRIIDLLTLYFNTRFTKKPLRFFGAIGFAFFSLGAFILLWIFIQKLLFGYPIGDRQELMLAILAMVLGVQAAATGLLGEIIVFTHGRDTAEYRIDKII